MVTVVAVTCDRCKREAKGVIPRGAGKDGKPRYIRYVTDPVDGKRYCFALVIQGEDRDTPAPDLCWGCVWALFTSGRASVTTPPLTPEEIEKLPEGSALDDDPRNAVTVAPRRSS
jgi:hypothetical protein